MSHPALKRFTYFGQLGILGGLIGGGLILAVLVSFIPFLTNPELRGLVGSSPDKITEKLLVPENANILRVVQLLSTFCLFFLPTVLYAKICHKRAFMHLGYAKPISFLQIVVAISIMLACVPLSGLLSQLFEMLPFPDAWMQKFKRARKIMQNKLMSSVAWIISVTTWFHFLCWLFYQDFSKKHFFVAAYKIF
jgi:hypothetical protein